MPAPKPYTYLVHEILGVHDGDTITAMLDIGFSTFREVILRLDGLDTPEVTGPQSAAGKAVRDWLKKRLASAREVVVESKSIDKYGRSLAVVYADGESVNRELIALGMAASYSGKGQRAWSKADLAKAITAATA